MSCPALSLIKRSTWDAASRVQPSADPTIRRNTGMPQKIGGWPFWMMIIDSVMVMTAVKNKMVYAIHWVNSPKGEEAKAAASSRVS